LLSFFSYLDDGFGLGVPASCNAFRLSQSEWASDVVESLDDPDCPTRVKSLDDPDRPTRVKSLDDPDRPSELRRLPIPARNEYKKRNEHRKRRNRVDHVVP
jgi:hypothetical protein